MATLPGYDTGRTMTPREILWSSKGAIYHPGGIVVSSAGIDGGNTGYTNEIRAGWPLGRITATGLYVPCKCTLTRAFASSGESSSDGDYTIVPVDNAAPFVVGDTVSVGADTGLTITAVDYDSHLITVDNGTFSVGNGEVVKATDGGGTCVGFLAEFVKLRNVENDAAESKSASMLIAGTLNADYLLGDIAAILADTAALIDGFKFFSPTNGTYLN